MCREKAPACPLSCLRSCRSKAEMRHTCRGTINLATANITVEDSCNFIISNGGAQTYHLKASSEVERQRWVTALELAKAKAVKMLAESGGASPCRADLLCPHCHLITSCLLAARRAESFLEGWLSARQFSPSGDVW